MQPGTGRFVRGGFPINEYWDGQSDTLCAVKPLQSAMRTAFCRTATNERYHNTPEQELNPSDAEQDHGHAEDYARYYREKTGIRKAEELERIRRFYQEFNAWLREIREHRLSAARCQNRIRFR